MTNRSRLSVLLTSVLALSLSGCSVFSHKVEAPPPEPNPWPTVRTAVPAKPGARAEAIGNYTAGCLRGGVALPENGDGFQTMRLSRMRYFGHPALIAYVKKLARFAKRAGLRPLLIGDLAQPRGGPNNTNHRSHQTGLDADIWFWQDEALKDPHVHLTTAERESLSAPSVVAEDHVSLDPKFWSPAQVRILKFAASQPGVGRIFVHAAIKRELCRHARPTDAGWLRKLRPWFAHNDHFHVRLDCPKNQPRCTVQEPVPPGDGCDSSLDWWFSEEAHAKETSYEAVAVPPVPKLPAACDDILHAP